MSSKVYELPVDQALSSFRLVRILTIKIDLILDQVSFEYQLLSPSGQAVSSGAVTLEISFWNEFIRIVLSAPGQTFEEKIHSGLLVNFLLPHVPANGFTKEHPSPVR